MTRRGSIRHRVLAACATAVAVTALPAAAEAKLVDVISVAKSVHVAGGDSASASLKCPDNAVALNGAADSGLASIDSVPAPTARTWRFRFEPTEGARDVRTVLRCVRMRLPQGVAGVSLAVETKIEPVLEIPAGGTQRLAPRCSHGFVPTGWGLERNETGLAIAAAVPSKRGWRFVIENTAGTGASGTLYTRCLERKQRADTGQRHAFVTRTVSASVSGPSATRSCPGSDYSVATGLSIPTRDDIFVSGTGPVGRHDGQWRFANASGAGSVKTSLICLSTTTRFR